MNEGSSREWGGGRGGKEGGKTTNEIVPLMKSCLNFLTFLVRVWWH